MGRLGEEEVESQSSQCRGYRSRRELFTKANGVTYPCDRSPNQGQWSYLSTPVTVAVQWPYPIYGDRDS